MSAVPAWDDKSLPRWWRGKRLTPGAVCRLALAIFVKFDFASHKPKPRGKSSGRTLGARFEPRKRFRTFRKRKRAVIA